MIHGELRQRLENFPKYPGTKLTKPASVCNLGFPSSFNLSFGEPEMRDAFGQYLDYDKDLVYSKIQPCIRHQDWEIIKDDPENRYRYLSVFDMADVSGLIILLDGSKLQEAARFAINALFSFLNSLGLEKEKLHVAYFLETSIKEATNGKYNIERAFPTDLMVNYWKQTIGLKDDQFLIDQTRNTMLALNVFGLSTPWGYRNEIFYEHEGKLLDIATVEYLPYRPIFDEDGKIIDIEEFDHTLAISAVGVERILMVVNNLSNIWEVDSVKPLVDRVLQLSTISDNEHQMIVAQALRAIHRISVDCGSYSMLNSRRKEYLRNFYRSFFQSLEILKIEFDRNTIESLLRLNATLQDFYPELDERIDIALEQIMARKEAFENDRSLKDRGVAQE